VEEEEEVEVERPSRHAMAADALLSELLTKVGRVRDDEHSSMVESR
jgi:hypothetical protein